MRGRVGGRREGGKWEGGRGEKEGNKEKEEGGMMEKMCPCGTADSGR